MHLAQLPSDVVPYRPGNRTETTWMERNALATRIASVAYLTGSFRLRSGQTSTYYWDKYRFESDPNLLRAIAAHLAALLPPAFDQLAGLELGGVPLATALALHVGRPCLFVRKKAKDYGTCNLAEGGFVAGDRIVVIEDVVTTAGQVCSSVGDLRDLGLRVEHVLCVIDREQGGSAALDAIGCELRPLFTFRELQAVLSQE